MTPFTNVIRLVALLLCLLSNGCFFGMWTFGPSHAARAAGLREKGEYDAAIAEYRLHMEERKKTINRPPDEKPEFYELLIGDVQLDAGRPEEALESYQHAIDAGVQPELINFKLRQLGHWYEKQGQVDKAIQELTRFRERDPVLFDFDIDRLHKKLIEQEDTGTPPGTEERH